MIISPCKRQREVDQPVLVLPGHAYNYHQNGTVKRRRVDALPRLKRLREDSLPPVVTLKKPRFIQPVVPQAAESQISRPCTSLAIYEGPTTVQECFPQVKALTDKVKKMGAAKFQEGCEQITRDLGKQLVDPRQGRSLLFLPFEIDSSEDDEDTMTDIQPLDPAMIDDVDM
eukprot:Blabericola_migrator_1__570@NODE_1140_length_5303_cov_96_490451_g776_i0_p4_GENE_NODE_1140_length_5303_cov_96_490451_g776_i0NODE_1140_length_5303_cov_96_490451_g776_i0_p4_ORF_typecomplete_len171_score18_42_NODE_1140_length_5303_cov_96_490451_g776_i018122324